MPNWLEADELELVCYCIEVNKKTIIEAVKNGNNTLSKIKESTNACTGSNCKDLHPSGKCCSKDIKNLIQLYLNETSSENCTCCNA
jgi:NAD(P)H-nitrite reductase large subunit